MITIFASYFLRFTGTRNSPIWPCFLFCWEKQKQQENFHWLLPPPPTCPLAHYSVPPSTGVGPFLFQLKANSSYGYCPRILSQQFLLPLQCSFPLECINPHQCIRHAINSPNLKKKTSKTLYPFLPIGPFLFFFKAKLLNKFSILVSPISLLFS